MFMIRGVTYADIISNLESLFSRFMLISHYGLGHIPHLRPLSAPAHTYNF